MKSKKWLPLFVFMTIVAMLVGACAPAAVATPAPTTPAQVQKETVIVPQEVEKVVTATPPPSGPVTLTFWHGYNADTETPFLEKTVIPAFEAAHPNIKVQDVNIPYDQFHQKLLTAIAGGTAPDLARLDIIWTPEFGDMGALAPLDEVMSDFATYKDAVFPGPLSTNFIGGHYYGLPLDTNTRVLVYNKDVFSAAGIENPPATVDDFLADCAKIKALGANHWCFGDGGTYAWAVDPWIWSFGGAMTSPDYTTSTGYLNGAQTVAAYQFLKDGVDKGYIHPGIKGGGVDTWGLLGKGQIAMILEGPWFPPSFKSQFPDVKYGMALMPAGQGGSISVVGGEDIAMFQQSKNKEAAAEFIRFMLSLDTQLQMATVGQMPVLTETTSSENLAKLPDYFGIFLEQLKNAQARTPVSNWTRVEQILTDAGTAILNGKGTPQANLDDAVSKIDPLLPKPAQ
ncbi:MAG: extracellular solute-binding protein [Chloroflexi bacterium]|nr:extracellular solute-binding protein [Chloroflexota bacterium]